MPVTTTPPSDHVRALALHRLPQQIADLNDDVRASRSRGPVSLVQDVHWLRSPQTPVLVTELKGRGTDQFDPSGVETENAVTAITLTLSTKTVWVDLWLWCQSALRSLSIPMYVNVETCPSSIEKPSQYLWVGHSGCFPVLYEKSSLKREIFAADTTSTAIIEFPSGFFTTGRGRPAGVAQWHKPKSDKN